MIKRTDFGIPFALHASSKVDARVLARIREIAPEIFSADDVPEWVRLGGIRSAVIGVATIDSVLDPLACGIAPTHPDAIAPLPPDQRRWFFGPIGYLLRDVRALRTPVRCGGAQPFWHLPPDIEAQVRPQMMDVQP